MNLTIIILLRIVNSRWPTTSKHQPRLEMADGARKNIKNSLWVSSWFIQGSNFMEEIGRKFQSLLPLAQGPRSAPMPKNILIRSKKLPLIRRKHLKGTPLLRNPLPLTGMKAPPTTLITSTKCTNFVTADQSSAWRLVSSNSGTS